MSRLQSYRDLVVWQKGIDLVDAVYRLTQGWPREERFGLVDQVRRAAVSVPTNVAEGQGRTGPKEFLHHLSIAKGSLHEVETLLVIGRRLGYVDEATTQGLMSQTTEIGRLLLGLIRSLRPSRASSGLP